MASLRSRPAPVIRVSGQSPFFMPVMANAGAGPKGEFQIDGLLVGTCVSLGRRPRACFLNPCLWTDKPVTVDLAAGAAVSGISVVASKGVIVTVRVQDAEGRLAANPTNDDVRIRTYRGKSPFIPGLVSERDATGRTMPVVVPPGLPAAILVSSAAFVRAEGQGKRIGAWCNADSGVERKGSNGRQHIRDGAPSDNQLTEVEKRWHVYFRIATAISLPDRALFATLLLHWRIAPARY